MATARRHKLCDQAGMPDPPWTHHTSGSHYKMSKNRRWHKPEHQNSPGSAPAPGAVFRTLAENLVRPKKSADCAWVRTTEWLDAKARPATPEAGVHPSFRVRDKLTVAEVVADKTARRPAFSYAGNRHQFNYKTPVKPPEKFRPRLSHKAADQVGVGTARPHIQPPPHPSALRGCRPAMFPCARLAGRVPSPGVGFAHALTLSVAVTGVVRLRIFLSPNFPWLSRPGMAQCRPVLRSL